MTATINEQSTARRAPSSKAAVSLGAPPRVSLMPPELGERNRQLGIQRSLRAVMVLVLVLVLAAVGGVWYLSFNSTLALVAENERTLELQVQKQSYREIQEAMTDVSLGAAAIQVGGSTEIDLLDYLSKLQASLPEGVRLDVFKIENSSIMSIYPQSDIPLEGPRIATLTFTAISPGLPEIPVWLDGLRELPGYVDAVPNSVTLEGEGYTVNITMHIDARAYSYRMQTEAERAEELGVNVGAAGEGTEK